MNGGNGDTKEKQEKEEIRETRLVSGGEVLNISETVTAYMRFDTNDMYDIPTGQAEGKAYIPYIHSAGLIGNNGRF